MPLHAGHMYLSNAFQCAGVHAAGTECSPMVPCTELLRRLKFWTLLYLESILPQHQLKFSPAYYSGVFILCMYMYLLAHRLRERRSGTYN